MTNKVTTLAFLSAKGGSGKTVVASSLATLLSSLDLRILLVDTDASTNGLTLLFLDQLLSLRKNDAGRLRKGLFEAGGGAPPEVIKISDRLGLIPAAFKLRNTEETSIDVFERNLSYVLENETQYDLIFLDAQAGADQYARIAAGLSDIHLIVSEYDPVSAQGIDRLKVLFSKEMDAPDTFTLFNKILPEFATVIGDGLAVARYLPPIPWDADVVRAFARRDLAISTDAPNPFTLAISQVALGCLYDVTGETIERWRGQTLRAQTDPMKMRLADLYSIRKTIARSRWTDIFPYISVVTTALVFVFFPLASFAIKIQEDPTIWSAIFSQPVRMFFLENRSTIYSLAASILTIFIIGVIFMFYRNSKKYTESAGWLTIQDEINRLETAMRASEKALKVTVPGPYGSLRRSSAKE